MEILAARMSVADTVGDAAGSRRSTLASCVAVRRYLSKHTPAVSRARDAAGAPHGGSCDARLLALRGQDCPHLAQPQGRRRLGRSLAGDVLVVLAELVEGAALCRRLERLRSERRRVERAVLGGEQLQLRVVERPVAQQVLALAEVQLDGHRLRPVGRLRDLRVAPTRLGNATDSQCFYEIFKIFRRC